MKQSSFSVPSVLLLAIAFLVASCSKTGSTGPAGPAGPQGATGATGATGVAGSANVIYSPWLNVTFTGTDSTGWSASIAAPKLVDSILNKGEIKVYFNAGSDSTSGQVVLALPIYEPFLIGAIINPYYTSQMITLIASGNVSSFTIRTYHYFQYRYVLIPGGITALPVAANGTKATSINWNDYNQVKKYLNLKN